MNIRKNNEISVFVENSDTQMFFSNPDLGVYILEISPNKNNERVFTISKKGYLDFGQSSIVEAFEEFLANMFGNNVLYNGYQSKNINFDYENKTITIKSDSSNKAILKISFQNREIIFQVFKEVEEKYVNHAIYLYSDCNLRGGYAKCFRELFEKLNLLALEPNKPQERIRKQ